MGQIIFVTGGARSGKSTFAEQKVKDFGENIVYVATAVPFDDGMKDRIRKHRESRPSTWTTIEAFRDFDQHFNQECVKLADGIIFDCVTVMVTNLMMAPKVDFEMVDMIFVNELEQKIQDEVDRLIATVRKLDLNIVIVSNEVGLGLVPFYKMGNFFRDIAGRINQKIASEADSVYFTVSGIPMKIK
ncbi:bifunctional adenosylcobinamide kinase/adenosylcobinamide-phosphate guanylyltransferase [Fusibacter ferrireducens]|uniref:Adenosylcobinamide kinase n=1 Tax=Fusibacter ferrireducens TaxID=2785058 RepID=A0ABR9ZWE9_9FIRM|nr:bifunctional adenosylcobinamide kinase/adenosylcobinamide-phosphate guanylyltransferase [Fusibacter ferrireducens]MBF4694780.1 bifunctional adenosylcobinamide kinase/adenosylcobinamide-phosphate guanylyltransferase [Fusibacter ferrireducens]